MGKKISKLYRLDGTVVAAIEERAKAEGVSYTDVVERAILEFAKKYAAHNPSVDLLAAIKDAEAATLRLRKATKSAGKAVSAAK